MQQLDFASVIADQDAALANGETIRIVRSDPPARRQFVHNPQCNGQSEVCRCDGRGTGGIKMPKPKPGETLLQPHRDPVEVLPRAQGPLDLADDRGIKRMSRARMEARAKLA